MRFQNIYESNFDYEATYQALSSTLKGVTITRKGLISFRFKPQNIEVLLSPKGKIQVTWSSEEEKEQFMPILNSLLKSSEGQKLTLKPLHTNILKVSYPGPKKLSFAWCKEKVSYFRRLGILAWWEERAQRKLREKQYNDERLDKQIDDLEKECEKIIEEMEQSEA